MGHGRYLHCEMYKYLVHISACNLCRKSLWIWRTELRPSKSAQAAFRKPRHMGIGCKMSLSSYVICLILFLDSLSVFISSVFSVVSVLNLREQSEISHHLLFLWRLAPPLTCTQRHLRMYTQRHLIMHTQRHMIMHTRAFSTFHKINYYQSLLTRSHQYVF